MRNYALALMFCVCTSIAVDIDIIFEPASATKAYLNDSNGIPWGDSISLNVTFVLRNGVEDDYVLDVQFKCANSDICTVNNGEALLINFTSSNRHVKVETTLNSLFIGRSWLVVKSHHLYERNASDKNAIRANINFDKMEVASLRSRHSERLNKIFVVFIAVMIAFNTFMLGTQLHYQVIISVLRNPIGPTIGFCCQYIIMPLLAYTYATIFLHQWPNLQLGLFAYGCSPVDSGASFWTLLLEGNLGLSVTIIFLSSVAALGMMPLWLSTLGTTFYGKDLSLPWENILGFLLSFTIPIGLGMVFAWRKQHLVERIGSVIKTFTISLVIFIIVFFSYANWYIFFLIKWYTLVPGILMPTSSYIISYVVAKLACQRWREARTIAVGTSLQNAGKAFALLSEQVVFLAIAIVICQLSLEPPDSDMIIVMPVCCLMFTSVPLWLSLLGRTIAKRKFGRDFQVEK